MKKYLFLFCASLLSGVFVFAQVKDFEGKVYKTVVIGSQTWMAENLQTSHFANGDLIPEAKTESEWITAGKNGKPAWCYYDNKEGNGTTYGKLYNWFAVSDKRGLAPAGFTIPSSEAEEFTKLKKYLGSKDFTAKVAGKKIKSKTAWVPANGSNTVGFNALGAGVRKETGKFEKLNSIAGWWCKDEGMMTHEANELPITGCDEYLQADGSFFPSRRGSLVSNGLSVRCVKK
ncbi:MAG: fibrobacter succinogenes major paralogous domain-containing protein [Bacteroidetes bacterium]|nr:fibrobacter succinogenes major paralogous domain-containing protein [Bacteroidota bacterium]